MSGSYLLNWIRTIGFLFENSRIEIRPNTDLQTNLELSPDEPPTLTSLRELPGLDRNSLIGGPVTFVTLSPRYPPLTIAIVSKSFFTLSR